MICNICQVELVETKATFSYLEHTFNADVPRCPKCGQIYISEELVKDRIAKVETTLEDK